MIVVGIVLIILSIALPSVGNFTRNYRIAGDARGIAAQLALARMRAASGATKTRLNFNLAANTYKIEVWNQGSSAYQADTEGGIHGLSQGIAFGYGTIATPAGQQGAIAQTSPIYFNSRGIAVDSSGNATGNSVIYITNNGGAYCAVAVSVAGQPTAYKYSGAGWVAF